MPLLPVHSDQMIQRIAAPYLNWGVILVCVSAYIAMFELSPYARAEALHRFGFIAGAFFGSAPQPALPFGLPSSATLVTYAFLHGSNAHLIGNMVVLFVFASVVEDRFGHWGFAALYIGSAIVAALAEGLWAPTTTNVLIGASGAVAGVLGAYIVLFPRAKIAILLPIFISVAVRAWFVIGAWLLYDIVMLYYGEGSVAWLAHLAGFAVGVGAAAALRAIAPEVSHS